MPLNKVLTGLLLCLLCASCRYSHTHPEELWDITSRQRDSMTFAIEHHYTLNYNFCVKADSLTLLTHLPENLLHAPADTIKLYAGNEIVVANILKYPADSTTYWIKVARDQQTMGWIAEDVLLQNVVPCDPISEFIHAFSSRFVLGFVIMLGMGALFYLYRIIKRRKVYLVHLYDIHSFYPTLLCLLTASSAMLYGSLSSFAPETWLEFYYHPTLNPFGQPFILSAFLICIWMMLITSIAVVDDLRKQIPLEDAISYIVGLGCLCFIIYLILSLTIRIYIGYLIYGAYCYFSLRTYLRHYAMPYLCGKCGHPIRHLGRCPHCGTINKA